MPRENQPNPNARNCVNCAFSVEARMNPQDIKKVRVCRRFPPQMVPSFSQAGMTVNVLHPAVDESILCHEHRFLAEVANANSGPTEGPAN